MEGLDIQIDDQGKILVCTNNEKHALAVFNSFRSPACIVVDNKSDTAPEWRKSF